MNDGEASPDKSEIPTIIDINVEMPRMLAEELEERLEEVGFALLEACSAEKTFQEPGMLPKFIFRRFAELEPRMVALLFLCLHKRMLLAQCQ